MQHWKCGCEGVSIASKRNYKLISKSLRSGWWEIWAVKRLPNVVEDFFFNFRKCEIWFIQFTATRWWSADDEKRWSRRDKQIEILFAHRIPCRTFEKLHSENFKKRITFLFLISYFPLAFSSPLCTHIFSSLFLVLLISQFRERQNSRPLRAWKNREREKLLSKTRRKTVSQVGNRSRMLNVLTALCSWMHECVMGFDVSTSFRWLRFSRTRLETWFKGATRTRLNARSMCVFMYSCYVISSSLITKASWESRARAKDIIFIFNSLTRPPRRCERFESPTLSHFSSESSAQEGGKNN